jgi:hypothetical protein
VVVQVAAGELGLALHHGPPELGREVQEVRRPRARAAGSRDRLDGRVDGVVARVEHLVLAVERRIGEHAHAAVALELLERVLVLALHAVEERGERREALLQGGVQVRLLALVVLVRRVARREPLDARHHLVAEPVEHREQRAGDVVGVDLVAGEEQLMRARVRVEGRRGGAPPPVFDEVVDPREPVVGLLALALAVDEAGPPAAAVEDPQVGQLCRAQREARQLARLVAEGQVRVAGERAVLE